MHLFLLILDTNNAPSVRAIFPLQPVSGRRYCGCNRADFGNRVEEDAEPSAETSGRSPATNDERTPTDVDTRRANHGKRRSATT